MSKKSLLENMTDLEKSVALARLMWHEYKIHDGGNKHIGSHFYNDVLSHLPIWTYGEGSPTLYHPENMAIAWTAVNFANDEYVNGEDWMDGFFTWWGDADLWRLPPVEAQRAWLDKLLELATSSGMIRDAQSGKREVVPTGKGRG